VHYSTIISVTTKSVEKEGKSAQGCALNGSRNDKKNTKWLGQDLDWLSVRSKNKQIFRV